MSRIPIKGEVNFTFMTDEQIRTYTELIQNMIFAYKGVDEEKYSTLKQVWKDLTAENCKRLEAKPFKNSAPVMSKDVSVKFRKIQPCKNIKVKKVIH